MAPRTTLASLADGLKPLPRYVDEMLADVGKLGTIPCTASGVTTIALTPIPGVYAPTIAAYSNHMLFSFVAAGASGGSVTINVAGVGTKNLYQQDGTTQIGAGFLASGTFYIVAYSSALNSGAGGFYLAGGGGGGGGVGDFVGPAVAVDNAIVRFDGPTGKLGQGSIILVDDTGRIVFPGSTSGTVTLGAPAVAGASVLALPAATDTLVGKATTDTLTNKTFDTAATGNSLLINGVAATANTGSGSVMRGRGPTLAVNLSGDSGLIAFAGSVSGFITLRAPNGALGTPVLDLPVATDTLVGKATTDTLTNKTLTTPDINGGTADSLTSLSVRSTGAMFDRKFATADVLTSDKTLNLALGDANRTLTMGGNVNFAFSFALFGSDAILRSIVTGTDVTLPPSGSLPSVIVASGTSSSHTGNTTETTLATISLPANAMGANGNCRITAIMSYTGAAGTHQTKIKFGGTTYYDTGAIAGASYVTGRHQVHIVNKNATNSQSGTGNVNFSSSASALVTSAVDTTAAVSILITAQLGNAGDTATLEGYTVEVLR